MGILPQRRVLLGQLLMGLPAMPPSGRRRGAWDPGNPHDPARPQPAIFEAGNGGHFLTWVFLVGLMTVLCYATKSVGRMPNATAEVVTLAVAWVVWLGLTVLALRMPVVRVEFSPDGVRVRERTLFWKSDQMFAAGEVSVTDVSKNTDGEGGVSYDCHVVLPRLDKKRLLLAYRARTAFISESAARSHVERERIRALDALKVRERRAH
jgi:hypothetical protein